MSVSWIESIELCVSQMLMLEDGSSSIQETTFVESSVLI